MYRFKTDKNQDIIFTGTRIEMILTADIIKETSFVDGCCGTLGVGIYDLFIESKNNAFYIKVI